MDGQESSQLLEKCRSVRAGGESALLSVILGEQNLAALEAVAEAEDLKGLFRCAALDRYGELCELSSREESSEADRQKLLQKAARLLDRLLTVGDGDEEVRAVAYVWRRTLQSPRPFRTRSLAGSVPSAEDLDERARHDPSADLSWLASLGR